MNANEQQDRLNDLADMVLQSAFEVSNALGAGFLRRFIRRHFNMNSIFGGFGGLRLRLKLGFLSSSRDIGLRIIMRTFWLKGNLSWN